MKTYRNFTTRSLAALAVAAALITAAAPVLSQPNTAGQPATAAGASRQDRMREHIQTRLNRMAEQLKLEPSQQDAWNAYAKTVEGMAGTSLTRPAADADAAALVRFRAQLAAEQAQKLNQLADATATLQQALTPEQRTVLNDLVRHPGGMDHTRRFQRGPSAPAK